MNRNRKEPKPPFLNKREIHELACRLQTTDHVVATVLKVACPVKGCTNKLGMTRRGDPWLMCRRHWGTTPIDLQYKIWRAYRSWKRLERLRDISALHQKALAEALSNYIDVRNDAIRLAAKGEPEQMEVAL